MDTITIDLNRLRTVDEALGALYAALVDPERGESAVSDWLATVTASPRLGLPRHFDRAEQATFTVAVVGVAATARAQRVASAVNLAIARLNRAAIRATGAPIATVSPST